MSRTQSPWLALRVRPRFENLVTANLTSQGFDVFFPTYVVERQRDGRIRTIELPLFPGYVFCRVPRGSRTSVLMTPGVLFASGAGRAQETAVENELANLQKIVRSRLHYEVGPYTTPGVNVQVIEGSLRNVEGILVDPDNERIAIKVSLVERSIVVDLAEGTEVVPVTRSGRAPIPVPA